MSGFVNSSGFKGGILLIWMFAWACTVCVCEGWWGEVHACVCVCVCVRVCVCVGGGGLKGEDKESL